jgi:hypothetical protein
MPADSPRTRREHLAAWLTDRANPYFGRAIANRVWANFLGVGLVEAVDDLRETNPASNEVLLSALAGHLAASDYDLKALMRTILSSATYQRSSRASAANDADRRFYSRYFPRRLMAEVILDGLSAVTGAPTEFPGYPRGWRTLQLPDANVASYFLQSFGRPQRLITCACERSSEPSMAQVLHLANGDTIQEKLRAEGNRIDRLLERGADPDGAIEELYLGALARLPTAAERRAVHGVFTEAGENRREALEDVFWSVLTSREFLFNH